MSNETYGIEALAAAAISAPPHRLAALLVIGMVASGHWNTDGDKLQLRIERLADFLEERDISFAQKMGMPQQQGEGDDEDSPVPGTTETRPGVLSWGSE